MQTQTKTLQILKLQKDSIDHQIKQYVSDLMIEAPQTALSELYEDLEMMLGVVRNALSGQYSKIFAEGHTLNCLSDDEVEFVEDWFDSNEDDSTQELIVEIRDGDVLIDKIFQPQIQL